VNKYIKFYNLADQVTKIEWKNDLRIFGIIDRFFEQGLVNQIVNYDCTRPSRFSKSMLSICVYNNIHIKNSQSPIKEVGVNP